MCVHAGGGGGRHILGKGVGRHGYDGNAFRVGAGERADVAGGLAPAHLGHLHVQEHRVEKAGGRGGKPLHRLPAVPGLGDLNAVHGQQFGGDFHIDGIVLGQQNLTSLQRKGKRRGMLRSLGILRRGVDHGKRQDNGKRGALLRMAFHMDLTVHLGDEVLGDGHPQTGAHRAVDAKAHFPGIGLEEMGQKLGRHAHAGVGDHKFVLREVPPVQLDHRQGDGVPGCGKFHGVGEQVVKHLRHAEGVAQHLAVREVQVGGKTLSLTPGLEAEGLQTLLHAGLEVKGLAGDHHLALLQTGHVQNIVDESQKLAAGVLNFVQIVRHRFRLAGVLLGQGGQADDGVEGGAHVVGHAAEEGLLGLFVLPGHIQRVLQ